MATTELHNRAGPSSPSAFIQRMNERVEKLKKAREFSERMQRRVEELKKKNEEKIRLEKEQEERRQAELARQAEEKRLRQEQEAAELRRQEELQKEQEAAETERREKLEAALRAIRSIKLSEPSAEEKKWALSITGLEDNPALDEIAARLRAIAESSTVIIEIKPRIQIVIQPPKEEKISLSEKKQPEALPQEETVAYEFTKCLARFAQEAKGLTGIDRLVGFRNSFADEMDYVQFVSNSKKRTVQCATAIAINEESFEKAWWEQDVYVAILDAIKAELNLKGGMSKAKPLVILKGEISSCSNPEHAKILVIFATEIEIVINNGFYPSTRKRAVDCLPTFFSQDRLRPLEDAFDEHQFIEGIKGL